jgi:hypothetical protein
MARLVPPADARALSEAITRLAGDEALMARLGRTARVVYQSCYTENRMLQSYRQLYLDLLRAKYPMEAGTPVQAANRQPAEPEQQMSPSYSELVPTHREPKGGVQ